MATINADKKSDFSAAELAHILERIKLAQIHQNRSHLKTDICWMSTFFELKKLGFKIDENMFGNSCVILW